MSSASIMKRRPNLARRYRSALLRCLDRGPTASRATARRLGREAVALGMEALDLARIHEEALHAHFMPADTAAMRERPIRRARAFFAAAITPMEETHRSARESAASLIRLNLALRRRTRDLTASNRELKLEIARRLDVEETLRRSEQEARRLLDRSERFQQQLRLLSRRVLSVQEDERRRISRELHDVVAQVLTGINVRLAALKVEAMTNTRGLGGKISRTQRLVEKSVDIVHRFARELRPAVLDDLGLIPALHAFLKGFAKETGIRVSLTVSAKVEKLSVAKRTVLYRVAQESLTNVARHARAGRVDVSIRALRNAVDMQVKDDGTSFDVEQTLGARKFRRMGLLGMRERVEMMGGSFRIASAPGQGTSIHVRIPFRKGESGEK